MSLMELRPVECFKGPQDGCTIHVASTVSLPESISVPADALGIKRHVYKRVAHTPAWSAYEYDHCEVRG